ncbi:hypothetical protein PV721_37515 [Streptomyces sp. MB09-01]|uniref:hypothetical protein n=1 Tax=Streptomyces sp. MB09-01 TaxID=3028666 RepID=UPI0029A6C63F|nr:hypothetical protein [Streptomyces sp. MB09-01]MDX3539918.1 hypothetical protein [Streptomyces sp. MB09-01]
MTAGRTRRATIFGCPVSSITTPLLALSFVLRLRAALVLLWALGSDRKRHILERAHERAIAVTIA